MVNFREKTIPLCGKNLKIKDCRLSDLEEASKPIEEIMQELEDKKKEVEEIAENIKEELLEVEDLLNQKIDMQNLARKILAKPELKDDEILKVEKLQENAAKLKKQADKIKKQLKPLEEEFNTKLKELKDYTKETEPRLKYEQGKMCELLLEGITADEFVKEERVHDVTVAENISIFVEMHMANVSQDKINAKLREIVENKYDNSSFRQ